MKQDFYVYEHHRKDTGAVFYVGKGCGQRAKNLHNRGRYWNNVAKAAGGIRITYPVLGVDEEMALLAEMELIDAYRRMGVRITNITDGGEGTTGWVPTEEVKRKIGEANKNTPKASGERHGMYGKKHSEESLVKMRESQSSREWGEKHPFYGKHHTEETRKKISESRKGKRCGADNPFYSKTHTPESIAKMSAASKGRKQSEETKAKRRDAFVQSDYFKQKKKPVLCLTNGVVYESRTEAARQLGLWSESVKMVCQGKLKSTGGHKFEWSTK
jgi:FKBP-type peptidyl-prolyl cis-trans isomerase